MSALFRQSSANGEGKGEDDRKERFHSTKYSILTARVRLPGGRREVTARIADSSSKKGLVKLSQLWKRIEYEHEYPKPPAQHDCENCF
jgi:hypothetical protein